LEEDESMEKVDREGIKGIREKEREREERNRLEE